MKENIKKLKQNSGCLGWLFGLYSLFNKYNIKQPVNITLPKAMPVINTKPVHEAITGENLRYVHPELVPSQQEYQLQHGGKIERVYKNHDLRG